MTYGVVKIRSKVHRRGRAEYHIWNPKTNNWDPLDYRTMGKIEKHTWRSGRVVMGKSWFEDGDKWYVADRWMALPMRIIEELGLSNYVLETMEKKPRWQVILNQGNG